MRLTIVIPALLILLGCAQREPSVAPHINDPLRSPDVAALADRWEREQREVYRERERILAALDIRPGQTIADVGAGTGLFTAGLARATGPSGKVYAVDIVPEFVEHIRQRMAAAGVDNVEARLCKEDSVELPADSIDLAFVCDAYHHFEYPRSTLASIRRALRPGGVLVVIDFERIEGQSSAWTLEHVRAGRETTQAEIEAAGFELAPAGAGSARLEENYFLRFKARD